MEKKFRSEQRAIKRGHLRINYNRLPDPSGQLYSVFLERRGKHFGKWIFYKDLGVRMSDTELTVKN